REILLPHPGTHFPVNRIDARSGCRDQYRTSANPRFGNVVFKFQLLRTAVLLQHHCPHRVSPMSARRPRRHVQPLNRMRGSRLGSVRDSFRLPLYAEFPFFRSAHRAFINADNFFRIAALIGLRPVVFLETGVTFFGANLPFHFAQRCFIAAEIRLRAARLIVRRLWTSVGAACDFGGRPRRGADGPASPSSAEIAWLMRPRSDLSSANRLFRFTRILSGGVVVGSCSSRARGGTAQPGGSIPIRGSTVCRTLVPFLTNGVRSTAVPTSCMASFNTD